MGAKCNKKGRLEKRVNRMMGLFRLPLVVIGMGGEVARVVEVVVRAVALEHRPGRHP